MIDPSDFSAMPLPTGGVRCAGRVFATDAEARAWLAEAIPRRAKMLGVDDLTMRQFFGDDRKREPMTREQDQSRQSWTVPAVGLDPDRDKFSDMRAGDGMPAEPGSRKRLKIAQDAARQQFEERLQREAGPSDEVKKLREWAFSTYESLLMSDASEFEVARAEYLLRWANSEGADLTNFKSAAREFAKSQAEKRDAKAADIQTRRAELERELASLPPAPTAPGDTPGIPMGGAVRKLTRADGVETIDVLGPEENGARRLLASYPIDQASPELIQAAT